MRRLALAAVLGSLVLAACSDQQQQTPTEPGPSFKTTPVGFDCSTTGWLLSSLSAIFPSGNGKTLLTSAQDKLKAITQSCQSGKLKDAQAKAMFFDDWMFKKFQAGNLLGTRQTIGPSVLTLFKAVLNGVGLPGTEGIKPELVTSDAGTDVFEPGLGGGKTVYTQFFLAALQVPDNSFNETTLLIIDKQSDNTRLQIPPGQATAQFPPYYDFNAINASNNHVLNAGTFAHVEMCLYTNIDYPPGFAIGHNPVSGAPGFPFEILQNDGLHLLSACDGSNPNTSTMANPRSLEGIALFAWNSAKQTVTSILLPQPLEATMAVVGGSGSASGKTASLSPFGIVGAANLGFTEGGDPTGQGVFGFTGDFPVRWDTCSDGCFEFPEVRLTNNDDQGISDVPITVTLVKVGNSPGSFTTGGEGGSTTVVNTASETGIALFNNLTITEPGTYKLRFSTVNGPSLTSGEFTVSEVTTF